MTEHAPGAGTSPLASPASATRSASRPDSRTPAVEALLAHLAAAGFIGAPRSLGRDGQGRPLAPGPWPLAPGPWPQRWTVDAARTATMEHRCCLPLRAGAGLGSGAGTRGAHGAMGEHGGRGRPGSQAAAGCKRKRGRDQSCESLGSLRRDDGRRVRGDCIGRDLSRIAHGAPRPVIAHGAPRPGDRAWCSPPGHRAWCSPAGDRACGALRLVKEQMCPADPFAEPSGGKQSYRGVRCAAPGAAEPS